MLKIRSNRLGTSARSVSTTMMNTAAKLIEDITIEPNLEKDAVYCIDGEIGEPDVPIGPEVWE